MKLKKIIYRCFQYLYRLIFICYRWKTHGLEHIPRRGGAILAVNHSSALDPFLAGVMLPRTIWYLGRKSLFKNRLVRIVLSLQQMIPISRGKPDVSAIKRVIRLINSGEIVLIFPEGTRSTDGTLGRGREGIGMFVSHAHADVIPCYISGAWRVLPKGAIFPRPRMIRVIYGEPVPYETFARFPRTREGYQHISGEIMKRIAGLKSLLEEGKKN